MKVILLFLLIFMLSCTQVVEKQDKKVIKKDTTKVDSNWCFDQNIQTIILNNN